jgi:hypothetical protein
MTLSFCARKHGEIDVGVSAAQQVLDEETRSGSPNPGIMGAAHQRLSCLMADRGDYESSLQHAYENVEWGKRKATMSERFREGGLTYLAVALVNNKQPAKAEALIKTFPSYKRGNSIYDDLLDHCGFCNYLLKSGAKEEYPPYRHPF